MARAHETLFLISARDGAQAEFSAHHSGTYTCPDVHLGAQERFIDVRAPDMVRAWMHGLGCTEERLRRAVAAVGPELGEVCNHLGLVPALPLNALDGKGMAH